MSSQKPNHKAKKHLGQNFLNDQNYIKKIVDAIRADDKYSIFEIGPGLGAITSSLIQQCEVLNVIEYDDDIIPLLKGKLKNLGQIQIYNQDVLTFDFNNFYNLENKKLIIAGNLPYNISSPILFQMFNYTKLIKHLVFMLQKEVVERICAKPGSKQFGRISVMLQYKFKTESLFTVPPSAFSPQPKVTSQIIRLTPHKSLSEIAIKEDHLSLLVKTAFSQRRKTLRNTLKNMASPIIMKNIGIDPTARAETISVSQFVQLSNAILLEEK